MAHPADELSKPNASRVEAFSDGVLAIIITLLIFEIKIPELQNATSTLEAWHALLHLAPKFLSFLLSFIFIAVFWVNHHQFFHIVTHVDRGLLWLNNLLLLCLTIVPFPTGFMGEYPRNPVALALFACILSLSGISFNLMWRYTRHHGLIPPATSPELLRRTITRGLVGPVLYTLGICSAFLQPLLTWLILISVPLYYFLPARWDSRR